MISTVTPIGPVTGLATYIRDTLYSNWRTERRDIEKKWQKNLDAFNAVSTGFWKKGEAEEWRSDTFVQVTKMKVISAWSMIVDVVLQGGELPFMLKPSPMDLVRFEQLDDQSKELIEGQIEEMTQLIHQQYADCNADRQLLKCIMCDAIYGETWAKRYVQPVTKEWYAPVNYHSEQVVSCIDLNWKILDAPMARIPDEEIQCFKREVSTERLCESYRIELKSHGKNLTGFYPRYNDDNLSFIVTPAKNP